MTVPTDLMELPDNESACCAFLDFRRVSPMTTMANVSMVEGLADMRRLNVQALLVMGKEGLGVENQILGLVTKYDIALEQCRQSALLIPTKDKGAGTVRDVMTPWNELSLVSYLSLEGMTVLELQRMFRETDLTHLLVVEMRSDESAIVRGILCRILLAKHLRSRKTLS